MQDYKIKISWKSKTPHNICESLVTVEDCNKVDEEIQLGLTPYRAGLSEEDDNPASKGLKKSRLNDN